MNLGIREKVAFVTGGSRGMGRLATEMLAAEGFKVAIVARTKTDIDDTVTAITASGGSAIGVPADIVDQADVDRATGRAAVAAPPRPELGPDPRHVAHHPRRRERRRRVAGARFGRLRAHRRGRRGMGRIP